MKKWLIVLGTVCVSFSAIFVRVSSAPSLILAFYRVLFAAFLLLPFVLIKSREEVRKMSKKDLLLCGCSGLFLGLHFTLYFESLKYTSIASSVVLVDTEVFFVAAAMYLIDREKISKKGMIGIVAAFAGSVMIALADMGSASSELFGDFLALVGSFCMAVYTMIGRKCRNHMSTSVYTFFVYGAAAVTVAAGALIGGIPFTGYAVKDYTAAFGMTIFCTILGHSVYSWGLKYIQASFVSTVKLLEPLFASILGFLIFGEIPGVLVIIGGVIVISGILYYSRHIFR